MMLTLFNSLQQMKRYADEMTYRLNGNVEVNGVRPQYQGQHDARAQRSAMPAPMALASCGRQIQSPVSSTPSPSRAQGAEVTVDLLPQRAWRPSITPWTPTNEVDAGSEIPGEGFLRPYRGERIERSLTVRIPAGLTKGEHGFLFSDADTLNRLPNVASPAIATWIFADRIVSPGAQQQSLYFRSSSAADVLREDRTLPRCPPSVLNVMRPRDRRRSLRRNAGERA